MPAKTRRTVRKPEITRRKTRSAKAKPNKKVRAPKNRRQRQLKTNAVQKKKKTAAAAAGNVKKSQSGVWKIADPPNAPQPLEAVVVVVAPPPAPPTTAGWSCSDCTFRNVAERVTCEMCNNDRPGMLLTKLQRLQDSGAIAPNATALACPICLAAVPIGDGAVLAACLHAFCRACLVQCIRHSPRAEVTCPYMDATYGCKAALFDGEIRALLDEAAYAAHLQRSIDEDEVIAKNSFHCRTPNCTFWLVYEEQNDGPMLVLAADAPDEDAPQRWVLICPICKAKNCLSCTENHEGLTCKEFAQRKIDVRDRNMVTGILQEGIVIRCPYCKILLQKNGGCEYVICKCGHQVYWQREGGKGP